jgi:hypothetical protein
MNETKGEKLEQYRLNGNIGNFRNCRQEQRLKVICKDDGESKERVYNRTAIT